MDLTVPESVGLSSQRLERIKPVMQRYVDEQKFPGILTLVARKGKLVHLETCGMMDLENSKPLRTDAIFRIYSMTKPITSTAVLMLYEEGLFQLSDPITRFIPEFETMKVLENGKLVPLTRPITIRDLLTHTSGLSYGFDENIIDDMYRKDLWAVMDKNPPQSDEFIRILTKLPLAFQPGTAFGYSVATDVLGYLVQLVSDMPFDDYLQKNIFDPLGMLDTSFTIPDDKINRFAANYEPDKNGGLKLFDGVVNSSYRKLDGFPSGGGGLLSTAADYLRFASMLLNKGELDGTRLLGRKTVELMTINHLPAGVHPFEEKQSGFGLGGSVIIDLAPGQRVDSIGNFGWSGAATTHFWVDYKEEMIAILMTQVMNNTAPIHADFHVLVNQALVD